MEIQTMKKIFLLSAFTVGMGLGMTSCESYLDINQDPNSPSEENVTTGMIMPAAEMSIAGSYGDFLFITGGYFAQYYAQQFGTSNYLDYSRFNMSPTRSSGTYTQLYQKALNNLKNINDRASADGDWGTSLAATVLRAFTFQILVDCYGETPYTQALDPNNLSPIYDDGQTVYEGLLVELEEAISRVEPSASVCTNFLFPNQSADSWIKFANALRLKLLMRMSAVKDVQSEVAALIAENNFPASDIKWEGCWSDQAEKRNPLYSEEFAPGQQQNLVANLAIVNTMQVKDEVGNIEYTDPRLSAFFNPNTYGNYEGSISGTQYTGTATFNANYWCRPAVSYDQPVYLLTVAETEFFISEYYSRYGSASEAASHYAAAIEASFATAGVSGADEYLSRYPYDSNNAIKCIGIAKWVALAGVNPFESWCEIRRLDYPAFGEAEGDDFYNNSDESFDTSSYEPGTLYTPIQVFGQVGANKLLERYPYAESSSSRNENVPDFPGYTAPVFWAK